VSPEKDLTTVLQEAASLAEDLALEIGKPVPDALTKVRSDSGAAPDATPMEDASDLDAQLANLQELVDDAAAGVETPDEQGGAVSTPSNAEAAVSVAPKSAESESVEPGFQAGSAKDAPIGVVGNMPRRPKPELPPAPPAKTGGSATPAEVESLEQQTPSLISTVLLSALEKLARFLELLDEPFQFIGGRLRTLIGWFALATIGASVIVATLAMLM